MKRISMMSMVMGIVVVFTQNVFATTITYDVHNISGNQWEYTYNIINDTLGTDINEFSISFDYGLYESLTVVNSPSDWDTIAFDPALIFDVPDNGLVDYLALSSGITPGTTLSGLRVSFNWLGQDAPGSQYFEVIDPDNNYAVLDSGNTSPANADSAPVPEPGTLLLIGSGLMGLAGMRKRI